MIEIIDKLQILHNFVKFKMMLKMYTLFDMDTTGLPENYCKTNQD